MQRSTRSICDIYYYYYVFIFNEVFVYFFLLLIKQTGSDTLVCRMFDTPALRGPCYFH